MMVDLAPGWKIELDRGPGWLFVRLHGPFGKMADAKGIAESVWILMEHEFVRRVVLELDSVSELPADFLDELFVLAELVEREGGLLRLCGVRSDHHERLQEQDATRRFTPFRSRKEAVLGFYRPHQPR